MYTQLRIKKDLTAQLCQGLQQLLNTLIPWLHSEHLLESKAKIDGVNLAFPLFVSVVLTKGCLD